MTPAAPARALALIASLILTVRPAMAAEGTGEAETIRVEGEAARAPSDLMAFSTRIRAEDFATRITSVEELLRELAGVQVRSWGGLGAFATMSIRGSTAEQVNIYIDGVLLNSALGGGVNLADLRLDNIESIDVYRGFTPGWLGSAGIGGAVDIRTRRPAGGASGFDASVGYGSYNTSDLSAAGSWSGRLLGREADALVSFSGSGSDGDFRFFDNNGTPFDGGDDGFETRRNNRFWSGEILARSGFETDGGTRVDFRAGYTRRRQGVPGIDAFQSEAARSAMGRFLFRSGVSREASDGRLRIDMDVDFSRTTNEFDDRSGDTTGGLSTDTRNTIDAGGPTALLRWRPAAAGWRNHHLTLLAAARLETASLTDALNPVPDRGEASRVTWNVAVEDEIHLAGGRVVIGPSARWTSYRSRFDAPAGAPTPPAGRDAGGQASGRLGIAWMPAPGLALRANGGRFYRIPSFIEIFGDQGTVRGSDDLEPEEGWNYDAGVSWDARPGGALSRLRLETAFFRTDADNLIQFVQTSQSQVTARNTGRARVTGVEMSMALGLLGWLDGAIAYTWQVAEDRSDTFRRGSDLPGRPRHEVSARAGASRPWGRLFYDFDYIGPNYIDAAAAALTGSSTLSRDMLRLPGRYLHGAGVSLRLGGRAEVTMEVDNLFNVKTVDVARYPLPGRLVQARLRIGLP